MNYKEEVTRAMTLLAQDERTIFLGQNVIYPGAVDIGSTLQGVPKEKKIEMPVAEELQMGVSIGLSLMGYIPVSVYPRMDFLMRAMDQLVNHLDKLEAMSVGRFKPRVIIRTIVGASYPLNPGPQHYQDHTRLLEIALDSISVVRLEQADEVVQEYQRTLCSERSTILVEYGELMRQA